MAESASKTAASKTAASKTAATKQGEDPDVAPTDGPDVVPDGRVEPVEQEGGDIEDQQSGEPGALQTEAEESGITMTLAHPIDREQDKVFLGLDTDKDYKAGEQITVHSESAASTLINAGYAQVDPENPKAVAEALAGKGGK